MDHWNFQFPKLSEMTQLDIKLHLTLPSFIYFARSTRMLGLFPFFPAFSTINLTNQPYICVFDWKKRHLDLCRNTYSVKIASIRPAIIISKPFYPHTIFLLESYARLTKSTKNWVWNPFWNHRQVTKVCIERLAHRTSFIFHIFKSSDYANVKKKTGDNYRF